MSPQTEAVYDYMIERGKTLKPIRVCKMCKRTDVEFKSSANICSECYTAYIKLSKIEKKDLR